MLTVIKLAWKGMSATQWIVLRRDTNIVEATSILGIGDDCVVLPSSSAKIGLLEISALLIETISSHQWHIRCVIPILTLPQVHTYSISRGPCCWYKRAG